ncbi:MAG: hypothetical protein R3B09_24200 [Nannocystaceae bacterium]
MGHHDLRVVAASLGLAVLGCDEEPVDDADSVERCVDDEGGGQLGLDLAVTSGLVVDLSAADFTLRGSLGSPGGLALRRLRIGGVDATSDAFNFTRWSALLSVDALRSLPQDERGRVAVSVVVEDACGVTRPEPIQVTLDGGPPRYLPETLGIQPGLERQVLVSSESALAECWATSEVAGLTVTIDGQLLGDTPVTAAGSASAWVLTVRADPLIMGGGAGTVRCRDVVRHESVLTITVDVDG